MLSRELRGLAAELAKTSPDVLRKMNSALVRAESQGGRFGFIAGLTRDSKIESTSRYYAGHAGVHQHTAVADLVVVTDRLLPFEHGPGSAGDYIDDLRAVSAEYLIEWLVAGRPADTKMSRVEAAFDRYVQVRDDADATPEAIQSSGEAYVDTWNSVM